MLGFLAALYRQLRHSRPSNNSVFHIDGPAHEEQIDWGFTLGYIPPEGTVVDHLTLSSELANDPERLELLCRLCRIRFAEAGELPPVAASSAAEAWCYTI